MKKVAIIAIVSILVSILVAAWFYSERYMYVGSGNGYHYVMNKWTGKIYRADTDNTGYISERSISVF